MRMAIAMLVSGPVGTRVMSPSDAMSVSMMKAIACLSSMVRVSSSNFGPSSPESPWTRSSTGRGSMTIGTLMPL